MSKTYYPRLVLLSHFNALILTRDYDLDFIKLMGKCCVGKYMVHIPACNVVDLIYNYRTLRYNTSWIFQILNDYSSITVEHCVDGIHVRIQLIGDTYAHMFEMTDAELIECVITQYTNFIGSFISQAQCCMKIMGCIY